MNVEDLARVAKEYRDVEQDFFAELFTTGAAEAEKLIQARRKLDRCIDSVLVKKSATIPIWGTVVDGKVVWKTEETRLWS